jgi:hypothetical protein
MPVLLNLPSMSSRGKEKKGKGNSDVLDPR